MTEQEIVILLIGLGLGFILSWLIYVSCGYAMVERIRKQIEKKPSVGD